VIFIFPIKTPKSTPQSAPLITPLQLASGTITRVEMQFPLGVSALANIQLNLGLWQIFPSNQDSAFATSNETIGWDEDYDLDQPPYQLVATSWNNDPNWDHTITVRIVMTPIDTTQIALANEIAALLEGNS